MGTILPFKFKSTLNLVEEQKQATLTFLRNLIELVEQDKVCAVAYTYLIVDSRNIVAAINEEMTHDEAVRITKGIAYILSELNSHMKTTEGEPP